VCNGNVNNVRYNKNCEQNIRLPLLSVLTNCTVLNNIIFVRCVIPVVLSNNKNKLLVHMYIVTNTIIFLTVRLLLLRYSYMFRPSMLAIFRLYMKHLTISYIYM